MGFFLTLYFKHTEVENDIIMSSDLKTSKVSQMQHYYSSLLTVRITQTHLRSSWIATKQHSVGKIWRR